MGIYSHLTDDELRATRARLSASLTDRLTTPTAGGFNGRTVEYRQRMEDIRREIGDINAELGNRAGTPSRGPIYLV